MEGINRLKHHLIRIHHGIKPCIEVSEDVRLECKEALNNFREQKKKKKVNYLKKLA